MYSRDGQSYFVVDGHTRFWDGSPANQINRYGEGYIKCLHDYHVNLSPPGERWALPEFERYPEERMIHDLFEVGHADLAILQSADLTDWFVNGFTTTEQNGELAERHQGRFLINGRWDPRDGEAGLDRLEALHERWHLPGVMLCTAEWKGDSKGWKLSDPWAYRYLEKCEQLGIRNIHVHKGPTVYPMNRDSFDVADVDDAATVFPGLRFIVEHVGLPRLEDFCWIATQEPNVYGGLAMAMPFLYGRPRYFAQIIGELLYWLGEDRILFGSDYAVWPPGWLVERFADFQMPEDMQGEYGVLTRTAKKKILGLNAARLYDIKVPGELDLV
ncbi:amidohydrolase [Actinoplanes bogorensis]|uniref:Amidohydrolase n=1 Tax=Paractinoplanes bogorensis TaxID=1610840 RepID=A0ABS5YLM3_9ACTN|nr:amidohydrolase family protein [Actinoplanes bogorensis]MBU2664337.1 amidohydrolase [Actinoplanes bogorensis]